MPLFGAKDSPHLRQLSFTTHCERQCQELPRSCESRTWKLLYGRLPWLSGVLWQSISRSKEMVHLLHFGGFKPTKFVSIVCKVIFSCQEDSSQALGLLCDQNNDILVVSWGTSYAITKSLKKRLVLALVSKLFDPIAPVAPFTVGARLLQRDICQVTGPHWDDDLTQNKVQIFLVWSSEIPNLKNIKVPWSYLTGTLWYGRIAYNGWQFPGFFGALAFPRARVTTPSGEVKTELAFVFRKRKWRQWKCWPSQNCDCQQL